MPEREISSTTWPERIAAAVAGMCFAAAVAAGLSGFAPAFAADPQTTSDSEAAEPEQATAHPDPAIRGDVTADQVFGNWIIRSAGASTGFVAGQRVSFEKDGDFDGLNGPCQFAILRAELTIACRDGLRRGEAEFAADDERIIWRIDGASPVVIETAH